jgi:hypothetical protein
MQREFPEAADAEALFHKAEKELATLRRSNRHL